MAAAFLPMHLLSMLQLRELSLSSCVVLNVPLSLYQLSQLQALSISDCNRVLFAEGGYVAATQAAAKLQSLSLKRCNLTRLPPQVSHCHSRL